jgi:hypothetical protein
VRAVAPSGLSLRSFLNLSSMLSSRGSIVDSRALMAENGYGMGAIVGAGSRECRRAGRSGPCMCNECRARDRVFSTFPL